MLPRFLGVYATQEKAPSMGEFPRPAGKRKRLWFVWEAPEDKYKVQALNAVQQPMAEPQVISAKEFEGRFVFEPDCAAVPEAYDAVGAAFSPSLPGFLPQGGEPNAQSPQSLSIPKQSDGEDAFRADAPNLLMA